MRRERKKGSGFTLVELVVVIGIVAVLVGIALPSYTDSVRKGRRADAQSKLREFEVFAARRFTVDSSYECFADDADVCGTPTDSDHYTYTVVVDESRPALTYTVRAAPSGGQSDDECGTMTLNQTGHVTAAKSGCW